MSFFVYILKCADDSYYTGHTDAIESRLNEHVTGINFSYTKDRLPCTLVFVEEFGTREEALAAEIGIKKWSRAKKEALIARNWALLKQLSKRRGGK